MNTPGRGSTTSFPARIDVAFGQDDGEDQRRAALSEVLPRRPGQRERPAMPEGNLASRLALLDRTDPCHRPPQLLEQCSRVLMLVDVVPEDHGRHGPAERDIPASRYLRDDARRAAADDRLGPVIVTYAGRAGTRAPGAGRPALDSHTRWKTWLGECAGRGMSGCQQ